MWRASLEPCQDKRYVLVSVRRLEPDVPPRTTAMDVTAMDITQKKEDEKAYDVEVQSFHEPEKEP